MFASCARPLPLVVFLSLLTVPAATTAQEASTLNDAEIAHIAVTANAIDVEAARLALQRTTNEHLRQFASTMITDHSAVNEQAAALARRLGVTPADNDVSRSLSTDAEAARQKLERASAAAFDSAYMEREVAYHEAVLQALDQTLIPGARNAELKALLQQARGAVAVHLEHARTLRAALAGR